MNVRPNLTPGYTLTATPHRSTPPFAEDFILDSSCRSITSLFTPEPYSSQIGLTAWRLAGCERGILRIEGAVPSGVGFESPLPHQYFNP